MIRVLIIEDDPMVASIHKEYLQRISDFRLSGQVADGAEAMEFLEMQRVDLIFLDVFMPHMDGLAFLQECKRRYPQIDILMITAAQNAEDIKTALSYGIIDYIIKPFRFERLKIALSAYKERVSLLSGHDQVEQDLLDRKIFLQTGVSLPLPKGIDPHTLAYIQKVAARQKKSFTTQDLANSVRISRISVRKYLIYLEEQGMVRSELIYRPKGRPVHVYTFLLPEVSKP